MRVLLCVLVLLSCATLRAQTDIDTDIFAGRITPPEAPSDILTSLVGRTMAIGQIKEPRSPETPRVQLLTSTTFLETDAASTGQVTTGFVLPAARLRVTGSYSYADPHAADHLDAYGAAVRWKAFAGERTSVTFIGSHADTHDTSWKTQAGVVAERHIGGPFTLGFDGRWTERSSRAGREEDLVPLITLGANLGTVILGVGYTIENDVDGNDDFSGQLEVPLQLAKIKLGSVSAAFSERGSWRIGFSRLFDF